MLNEDYQFLNYSDIACSSVIHENGRWISFDLDDPDTYHAFLQQDNSILQLLEIIAREKQNFKIISQFNYSSDRILGTSSWTGYNVDITYSLTKIELEKFLEDANFTIDYSFSSQFQISMAQEVKNIISEALIRLEERLSKRKLLTTRRKIFQGKRNALMPLIIERDGNECRICQANENLSIDHIIPISKEGPDDLDNLQILCRSCNSRKGNR